MRLTSFLPLAVLSSMTFAGCTMDGDQPSTSTNTSEISTCGVCDGATFTDYRRGDRSQFSWPKAVNRLNVVYMQGDATYFYVWGVGNGAVQFLLRATYDDTSSLQHDMSDALMEQQGVGGSRFYGSTGTWTKPGSPNPPVGPGGFPPLYVKRMLSSVQSMNDAQDHLGNVAPGLQGGY